MRFNFAQWPCPSNVMAGTATRLKGHSQYPFHNNNLAMHVGDNEQQVLQNRQALAKQLAFINEPIWLEQTHTNHCVVAEKEIERHADASITREKHLPLVVLTADCLPIVLCNQQGSEIAAIHAGWRGLFNGIIENTLAKMNSQVSTLMAWVGPAICQNCYEVGDEIYHAFTTKWPQTQAAFKANQMKWLANLPAIAEYVLNQQGVKSVFQSGLCTFESNQEYFSYRREPQTGRIGTFIWLNDQPQDN